MIAHLGKAHPTPSLNISDAMAKLISGEPPLPQPNSPQTTDVTLLNTSGGQMGRWFQRSVGVIVVMTQLNDDDPVSCLVLTLCLLTRTDWRPTALTS